MALPWLLIGLGNPPSQIQPGYRSLLAFWSGGAANAGDAPEPQAGYRSLLAFWAGGAANAGEAPEPEPDQQTGGAYARIVNEGERKFRKRKRERERELDEAVERLVAPPVPHVEPIVAAPEVIQALVPEGAEPIMLNPSPLMRARFPSVLDTEEDDIAVILLMME